MAANLFRVILPVDDLERADAFWERMLGLPIDKAVPTRHYIQTGGALLVLVDPIEHSGGHEQDQPAFRSNPEVVYFGGIHPEAILLVKQMRERLGMDAIFMSGDGVFVDEFYKIAGKAAEGSYLSFTPDQAKIPEAKGIIEKHRKRFGKEVGAYTIYSYVAANLILSSIEETGSRDGSKIAAHLRSRAWKTALGKIQFDSKGDVLESPYVFWQVKGGKFVQID